MINRTGKSFYIAAKKLFLRLRYFLGVVNKITDKSFYIFFSAKLRNIVFKYIFFFGIA